MKRIHLIGIIIFFAFQFSSAQTSTIEGNLEVYSSTDHTTLLIGKGTKSNPRVDSARNTFIGFKAGAEIFEGSSNTFIGYLSGNRTTYGTGNTFLGSKTGHLNTWGSSNVFIGRESGSSTVNGSHNTFIGRSSGNNVTSGSSNIAIGSNSGGLINNGSQNCVIGSYQSPVFATSHNTQNTVVGTEGFGDLISGNFNTSLGYRAGAERTHGNLNTFLGYESGVSDDYGDQNVCVGYRAGYDMDGSQNIVIGPNAGLNYTIYSKSLIIDIERTSYPLIYGNFLTNQLKVNGELIIDTLTVEGNPSISSDDAVIRSAPYLSSSDLILSSNDKVIIDLDANDNENASFSVRNSSNETILNLLENGNLYVDGTLIHSSDINRKHDIQNVNKKEILKKIQNLEIKRWKYRGEDYDHLGPMAQDFYQAFGLGASNTTIATVDPDGVALAGIQALAIENSELRSEIELLKNTLAELITKVK